jgi:polyvinyl alcohol dehydrogenase (cytochrome)
MTHIPLSILLLCAASTSAQQPTVPATAPLVYAQRCAQCHDHPDTSRAPGLAILRARTAEAIYAALTSGPMQPQAKELPDTSKRLLAEFLSGRPIGAAVSGEASAMPNRCMPTPLTNPLRDAPWNGWGVDVTNTRFQQNPGIATEQVPHLTLKWAFGFPNATSAYGQPAVAGGRLYAGSDAGYVYSLDASTGCVYWSFAPKAGMRTAISIGPLKNQRNRFAIYFGDLKANVYAVDADRGALLWTQSADTHAFARITGAPLLFENRLYVPVTSLEESAGGLPTYECCTFRGSIVAYDATTGKQLWKTYSIADAPKPTRKTSVGTQLYGPSGGGIWSAPALDAKRKLLYVTTGDAYSEPADVGTDAILALDLDSGKVKWKRQMTAGDAWLVGCSPNPNAPGRSETCPQKQGPDADFGSSASLVKVPGGRDVVVAQQKSAVVWGLDPDTGAVLWSKRIGRGGPVQFGHAIGDGVGYFAAPDSRATEEFGGLWALNLTNGARIWRTAIICKPEEQGCTSAHLGAVTALPGAVLATTSDGKVRAYDSADGHITWEYDSAREYEAVNRLLAKGGQISGPGPVVAGGMVFVTSGYSAIGGNAPGNVLLAFEVK